MPSSNERTKMWRPIEDAPIDMHVLLFSPNRHASNPSRIEVGVAHTSRGSHHAWATHWAYLPAPPPDEEIAAALKREQDAERI